MKATLVLCLARQRLLPSDPLHDLLGCIVIPELGREMSGEGFLACNSAGIGIVDRRHGETGLIHRDWSRPYLFDLRPDFLRLQVNILVLLILELGTDLIKSFLLLPESLQR